MRLQKTIAIFVSFTCSVTLLSAQQPFVERPKARIVFRPYKPATVGSSPTVNSDRLRGLIRAGRLYLTLQDAIALAIENNLDLQIDRYGPLTAEWALERARGGGPLKGVPTATGGSTLVTSGQGVAGATQSAGLSNNNGNSGGNNGNTTISQIGPITPNLDPVFQNASTWAHQSQLYPNATLAGSNTLVDITHRFSSFVQQGLITGGTVQIAQSEQYLKEDSPSNVLNPSVAPYAQITVRHSLLQGFGVPVNRRFITIDEKNIVSANVSFRSQLLNTVATVVNGYWDLVAGLDDLKAKQEALKFSEKFYEDTKKEIELGALAKVDIYRAEADFSSRKQDIVIAQQTASQYETNLKGLMSRNGLEDPLMDSAVIVPLDHIEVPQVDELPPLRELVAKAMASRPDVQLDLINDEVQAIGLQGTKNGILPQLQGMAQTTNRAVAGSPNPLSPQQPADYQIGGLGNGLGQIFRHDYTSRLGQIVFQGVVGNHQAQADYGIDQLTMRQSDLVERKNRNDMVVAISNQMIAVRQSGSRYRNAVSFRALQQDLLQKEQQKFALGSSTIDLIIAAERALAAAQYTEIAALQSYSRSRVLLDQTLGTTLETNHVSVEESLKGKLTYQSTLPAALPAN